MYIAVTDFDHEWVFWFFLFLSGRLCNFRLEKKLNDRQESRGYPSRSLEDSAENSVECGGPAQESLVGNKDLNNPVRLEANLVIFWQKKM